MSVYISQSFTFDIVYHLTTALLLILCILMWFSASKPQALSFAQFYKVTVPPILIRAASNLVYS